MGHGVWGRGQGERIGYFVRWYYSKSDRPI